MQEGRTDAEAHCSMVDGPLLASVSHALQPQIRCLTFTSNKRRERLDMDLVPHSILFGDAGLNYSASVTAERMCCNSVGCSAGFTLPPALDQIFPRPLLSSLPSSPLFSSRRAHSRMQGASLILMPCRPAATHGQPWTPPPSLSLGVRALSIPLVQGFFSRHSDWRV